MIDYHINCELTKRQPADSFLPSKTRYKASMSTRDKQSSLPATEIGSRILDAIGDDSYKTAAAKIQLHGGHVSAPGLHKWVTSNGEIKEPNLIAFCRAYRVNPAWLRYGVGDKTRQGGADGGLIEALPKEIKTEALDFIGYLIERKGPVIASDTMGRYMAMIDRIKDDMTKRKNGDA